MGWGSKWVIGGLTAAAVLCGHNLSACQLPQKPKPENRVEPKRDMVADLQKRLSDLLRASAGSTVPSRRIILQ